MSKRVLALVVTMVMLCLIGLPGVVGTAAGQPPTGDTKSLENEIMRTREDIKQIKAAIIGFEAKKLDISTGGLMPVYQKELFDKQMADLEVWYTEKTSTVTDEKALIALKTVYQLEKKSLQNRIKKLEGDLKRKPPTDDSKLEKQLDQNIKDAKAALAKKTKQLEKLLAQLAKTNPDSPLLKEPSEGSGEPIIEPSPDINPTPPISPTPPASPTPPMIP